jgi:predicted nucleic acid-binding Zn ribbon protein
MTKTPEWQTIERRIWKRDGYRCQAACGCTARLTVHHIIPRIEAGSDDDANLITLCSACHDEIEQTDIRSIERIRAYDSRWHATVTWYPTDRAKSPPRRTAAHRRQKTSKKPPDRKLIPCVVCGNMLDPYAGTKYCSARCIHIVTMRKQDESRKAWRRTHCVQDP